jgi:hypothetical protein
MRRILILLTAVAAIVSCQRAQTISVVPSPNDIQEIADALADKVGLDNAYWLLIPCFAYMIYYATCGYKVEYWIK